MNQVICLECGFDIDPRQCGSPSVNARLPPRRMEVILHAQGNDRIAFSFPMIPHLVAKTINSNEKFAHDNKPFILSSACQAQGTPVVSDRAGQLFVPPDRHLHMRGIGRSPEFVMFQPGYRMDQPGIARQRTRGKQRLC